MALRCWTTNDTLKGKEVKQRQYTFSRYIVRLDEYASLSDQGRARLKKLVPDIIYSEVPERSSRQSVLFATSNAGTLTERTKYVSLKE